MNIRDLKYLVAVARHRHFGKAAQACFVSQPTLSTQLKKLEEELGACLFERDNKNVQITPFGKTIVKQAQLILQEVDVLKQTAKQASDPFAGPFRLGIFPTAGPYLLPHLFPIIKQKLPTLEFILHEDKSDTLIQLLQEHQLDAVIQAIPTSFEQLQVLPLYDEYLYLAVHKNHALATKSTIQLQDIKKEPLLLLPEGHCLREHTLDACSFIKNRHGQSIVTIDFQATSLETLAQLVVMQAGIAIFPALAVTSLRTNNKDLVFIPFKKPLSRRLALLHRKQTTREAVFQQLTRWIQASMQKIQDVKIYQ